MLAPKIVQLPYTYSTDRASAPVVAIIAHNTVGTDSRKYLSQGGPRKVSIHCLIQKDGTLYRMVPDEKGANHAGFGKMPQGFPQLNPNRCTIGFELENASDGGKKVDPYTDAQLLTMGWEVNRIRAKYGNLPIFRHADIDPDRRADTVGLTVPEIEDWAKKAAAYFVFNPAQYRVKPILISQRSEGGPPYAGELRTGDIVEIDATYPNGYAHLRDGRGFVLLSAMEPFGRGGS